MNWPAKALSLLHRLQEKRRISIMTRASKFERYLLCRPRGGLNDCLSQVYKTILHSIRHKRQLIIDSAGCGLCDAFSNYFETVIPFANIQTALNDQTKEELNRIPCHPKYFQGKLESYQLYYNTEICNMVDFKSNERPCITTPDPPESLLLHDQLGGGAGYKALPYFKLTEKAAREIIKRLGMLPKHYIAIHLRASDVDLDFRSFLNHVKPQLKGCDVLVCTDSLKALNASLNILDESTTHQVATIPDTGGVRIHDNPKHTTRSTNLDAIADLIALARAEQIIYPFGPNIHTSGFAQLAIDLSNRKDLLRQLVGYNYWEGLGR